MARPSKTRVYNWFVIFSWGALHIAYNCRYVSLVAASCMVLYGYDASTFNAISGSKNWDKYFDGIVSDSSKSNQYGAINTAYTVGAIAAGWFMGGPLADYAGRRAGMAAGAVLVIIATIMQAFSPRHKIGVFIGGRVIIGVGQGLALSIYHLFPFELEDTLTMFGSRRPRIYQRAGTNRNSRRDYDLLADVLQCGFLYRILGALCMC
jgi:MFS family permease